MPHAGDTELPWVMVTARPSGPYIGLLRPHPLLYTLIYPDPYAYAPIGYEPLRHLVNQNTSIAEETPKNNTSLILQLSDAHTGIFQQNLLDSLFLFLSITFILDPVPSIQSKWILTRALLLVGFDHS
jgi:hypothetical protein